MPENDLENEIRDIVKEEIDLNVPKVVFPDVQKVEVTNLPAPVVNVPEPKVTVNVPEAKITVSAPQVNMDTKEFSRSIDNLAKEIQRLPQSDNTEVVDAITELGKQIEKSEKKVTVTGGSSLGSYLYNAQSTTINPATSDKQDDIITAIQAIPGGGGIQYTEGDVDSTITGNALIFEGGSNVLRAVSEAYPLPVDITQGVDVQFGPGTIDEFGHLVTGAINNQIDIQFYRDTVANLTTVTTANGGTASATNGMATFSATTTASSQAKGVSLTTTTYTAGGEVYALFTAGFTGTGAGTSYQRIGLYNANDGFFIGKEANTFGFTVRKGGSDTNYTLASSATEVQILDALTGAADSLYTRKGTPEAVDLTKLNVWRIRFGWVGSAPINFEILAPDGNWVTYARILQPNFAALPHINTADLPVTCDVFSGNSGNALTIITNCWAAGTTVALGKLNATITDATFVALTRSVITGVTTGGGGGYVNVKVNPSGALSADVTGTVTVGSLPNEGQQTMANSISVAIASNQSAIPVTQSGTWDEVGINDSGNSITVDATDLDIRNLVFATDKADVSGSTVQDIPATSGGLSKFHLVGAATTNATNIKASAGQVYAITAFNVAATPAYLKFHNTSGTPTAGSGVTDTFLIPGNTAGAGLVINFDKGIAFSTGIAITTTTGIADADTAAIAASNVVLNIYYK